MNLKVSCQNWQLPSHSFSLVVLTILTSSSTEEHRTLTHVETNQVDARAAIEAGVGCALIHTWDIKLGNVEQSTNMAHTMTQTYHRYLAPRSDK